MSKETADPAIAESGSGEKDGKRSGHGEKKSISPAALDNILNVLVALIVLCLLMTWGFLTLSFNAHLISIIVVPLLVYFLLSSSGMKLRAREAHSMLMLSDIIALVYIFILCLFMDQLYSSRDPGIYWKVIFCFVGIFGLMAYICRNRIMYYLAIPFIMVYTVLVSDIYGFNDDVTLFLTFTVLMVFILGITGHGFYFGYGRVCIEGKYSHMPEKQAKEFRKQQIAEEEEKRRKQKEESKRK